MNISLITVWWNHDTKYMVRLHLLQLKLFANETTWRALWRTWNSIGQMWNHKFISLCRFLTQNIVHFGWFNALNINNDCIFVCWCNRVHEKKYRFQWTDVEFKWERSRWIKCSIDSLLRVIHSPFHQKSCFFSLKNNFYFFLE